MIRDVVFLAGRWSQIAITAVVALGAHLSLGSVAHSTVVRFNFVNPTNPPTAGSVNVDVRLYNSATPLTVANFLHYATSGDSHSYNGTFIHRSVPGFVEQGGGYTYNAGTNTAPHISTYAPVQNEFGFSNLRGTIAMAKLGGDPNSATSEWFFNLADNSSNLDNQNGGFTVFGRVLGTGMTDVIDKIAQLPIYDVDGSSGSTFDATPLRTTSSLSQGLMFLNSVTVLNYKSGDYDFNGTVNSSDYAIWRTNFGSTTNAAPDGNGNGSADAADYVMYRKTLGQSGGPAASLNDGSVPEPSAAMLLLIASFFLALRRRASA